MNDEHAATGWCRREMHQRCDGTLHCGTGWNWYCICDCHGGEPRPAPDHSNARAIDFWRDKRAQRSAVSS